MVDVWYANDQHGGGIPTWGWQIEGPIEFTVGSGHFTQAVFLATGQGTPGTVTPSLRVYRPPTGTGHFLRHLVVWWADMPSFTAGTSIDGIHDLYDTDYLVTVDPTYPSGYTGDDVAAYLTPPPGAAFYTAAISDEGPYDGTGTTLPVGTTDYAPYAAIDVAIANLYGPATASLVRLDWSEAIDDHPRPDHPLWRRFAYPWTKRGLLIYRDGTVLETDTLERLEELTADAVVSGEWIIPTDDWTYDVLTAAGYSFVPYP